MFTLIVPLIFFFATTACFEDTLHSIASGEYCNHGAGEITYLGFLQNNVLTPRIMVCVDPSNNVTFWTKHYLSETSSCEESQDLVHMVKERLLESTTEFVVGFLTPSCDFETKSERELTHFSENTALFLTKLHYGNWKKLEEKIRKQLGRKAGKVPVKIITGAFGDSEKRTGHVFKVVVVDGKIFGTYVGVNFDGSEKKTLCERKPDCGWSSKEGKIYCCTLNARLMKRMGLELADLNN